MTKIKAAVRTFCDTAAFLCIAKEESMMADTVLIFTLLLYAAVILIAVRIIKYFIRYGIDYYFEKRTEYQKNQKNTED